MSLVLLLCDWSVMSQEQLCRFMRTATSNVLVYQLISRHQSCTAMSSTALASIGRSSAVTMATASSMISSISDTDTSVRGIFSQC